MNSNLNYIIYYSKISDQRNHIIQLQIIMTHNNNYYYLLIDKLYYFTHRAYGYGNLTTLIMILLNFSKLVFI